MAKKKSDNELIDEVLAESGFASTPVLQTSTEELLSSLPEEVIDEIAAGEVFTIEEELTDATTQESPVIEKAVSKPSKSAEKVEEKIPGYYYNGVRISKVLTNLGSKWTVMLDGKRTKVLRSKIEIIK